MAAPTAPIETLDAAAMRTQVERWSAINSGTGNLAGLGLMATTLADAFSILPGAIVLVDPEPAETITPEGEVRPTANGRHLHLRVRPQAPRQLLLTGHMDTVYAADHPFQQVRATDANTLNGPGVADMKGGLALMLAALAAAETSPLAAQIGYEVVINSDEETGSFSSSTLLAHAARGKLAALTYEPALPDGSLAGARRGTGNFSIIVRGRSAHAGRNPDDGRNAILAAADLALRLAEARSPRLAVNPARIDGGSPNNVVPDLAILRVNFRPTTLDDIVRARTYIDAAVATVAADRDVTIQIHGGFNRPPKSIDPGAERLFQLVKRCGTGLGLDLDWHATGGVCDGNNIAACGVPVVDTMGARGGAIHSVDEFLLLDSLVERAALSTLSILHLAEHGL